MANQNGIIMKKSFVFAAFVLFMAIGCGPKMTAGDYNNAIVGEQNKIIRLFLDLGMAVRVFDMEKADSIRNEAITQCNISLSELKNLPPFGNDARFRDKAVALVSFYDQILNNEYKEMLDILRKGEAIDVSDFNRLEEIQAKISEEENALDSQLEALQQEFASKHGISTTENHLQKDLETLQKAE